MRKRTEASPEFASVLRDLIARAGFPNASAAASAAGLAPSVMSRWFRGERPRLESLDKLAPVLRVPVSYLIALAYPDRHRPTDTPAATLVAVHPLARELDTILVTATEVERAALERVVDAVLSPYRDRDQRRRTAS